MEPVEVAKSLILGRFARPLTDGLYSGVTVDKIERYLARDLRVVNREAQQRFVAIIGPGLGLDVTSTNVFGTLTPTIDDVLGYTLKAGYALQVGFNYGAVNGDWKRNAKTLYSSELYALEKVVIEVEGKDASALDEARKAARRLVDGLLSYVDDVYLEFSGHKSYYIGLWLPEPIRGIKGLGISLGELYRRIGLRLARSLGKRDMSLIDKQYINAVKLLRVPGYMHEETGKPAQCLDTDFKPAEFDPGIMDRAVLSRGFINSVVSSIALAVEDTRPRRRVRHVKLGKVEEWGMVIRYMINEGIRVNDGRVRFSYVLGNYCAAKRLSLDKCRELHSRLVENANTREYQRYLEYGYQHPGYLPWPFVFFKGHEWYSVPDVEVFRDVYEALRGRIRRHIEAKHAPRPEAGSAKLNSTEVSPKANAGEATEATPSGASVEAGLLGNSSEDKADVREIVGIAKGLLESEYGNLTSRLEPIIEQMVGFIIEKGVVSKRELWDKFYSSVVKLVGSNDAESLFDDVVAAVTVAMVWMGLLMDDEDILTVVGKPSEAVVGAEAVKPSEPKTEPQASVEAEVKPSEPQVSEVKPGLKTEPGASEVEDKTEPQASEAKVIEAEPNAHSSGTTQKPVVDVRGVVDRVKSWLVILFKYNSEVVNKLEPIIEQMVSFIVERGVVGKWELWDRFYNEVEKLNTDDAGFLFSNTLDTIIMAMEGMGLLKVNKNILTVVGKTSEAETEGKSSGVSEVEVKPSEPQASEAKTEANAHSSGVEVNAQPKPPVEGNPSGVNQSSEASTPMPEPEPQPEPHGAHPKAKATINIGDYLNHSGAPVEAIVIRQSVIHSEPVEAPVNIATVDRVARRLCSNEDCLASARLAITFIINTVVKGPVRVSWLEKEFKSRYPIHYEALRSEGIGMWVILTQLRGLGIVVVGDLATPGGWHSRWVTGLVARLLEARGRVGINELVRMVRESEPDLPNAFDGGLTLGDHVVLAVRFLAWRGVARVEGEAVSLVK